MNGQSNIEVRPIGPSSVAVGSFDGLHLGHRALIERVKRVAAERGTSSLIVTFSPHPRQVLSPDSDFALLTTMREKGYLLSKIGVDCQCFIPFDDPAYNQMTYTRFVQWLIEIYGMEYMVIGFNHRFGRGGEGGAHNIASLAEQYGFEAEVFSQQLVDGLTVSSSEIRRVVAEGDMVLAAKLLGTPYLMIADRGADGLWRSDDCAKLMPPAGRYSVVIDGVAGEAVVFSGGGVELSSDVATEVAHIEFVNRL